MNPVTLRSLQAYKAQQQTFAVVTAYDATLAQLAADAGIEALLVGDSLGMVLQGQDSTLPVTLTDMVYHTRCVANGNRRAQRPALIMTDLPFMSYGTLEQGLASARAVMQAGAHMVKLEGDQWLAPLIASLAQQGVPVCAHLGLTPQSVNKLGGYRVQGRGQSHADTMVDAAVTLAEAGADMILLECVPADLGKRITQAVTVPVIGIGAGSATDSQVLVMHDMLGLNPNHVPKFVKNFATSGRTVPEALAAYNDEVKNRTFPSPEHEFA
ncbi:MULTISPECIES: 3-methyl-2-oxobutanoate hydroxymethyltransferase [unclassified Oceanobacter]|uniref:3-methyl-2-oxobutanoate hydroxymethyltransferase n=3 Tax=Gammaproteobacteria TaxID=1236 RepID=UPI0026E42E66|nr:MULTISPECIES: 3-methyl-2-oxobutanoate hydroxymethyltransferase [unclassified Oceanobacter]MDO6683162.1 3-methyl-2-oxobutanoate hydroxymethyltransferase [Oceanobacter sp. 5_MG-2023]MDP2506523.1 3-methyl-2-oxobutanoate hydroxymethyltransferase [Oceanobacter sp. 3_MG-2023]MDP2549085.1 3-methyl-2-oxobutanoate hydroxymethyltransferase [Oceanobacter sp. 4_MG-2023]MDP2609492.1 3-methyl-2-oxobutanoate hydroxymethyltransferase [Oceanobacter sp. 1_MG-2023]MDP2612808.1 3-methyl-2-oxobutanoate hydroxym